MYLKMEGDQVVKYPYSLAQMFSENKNVSFPKVLSDKFLESYGVYKVHSADKSELDNTRYLITLAQPVFEGGKWVEQWNQSPLPDNELAENARNLRNKLLADTDWLAVQDRVMSQAEIDYRQALRDITDQPTFPDSVVWPEL